jgi:hypothetical protein
MNQVFAPQLMFSGEFGVTHEIGEGIVSRYWECSHHLVARLNGGLLIPNQHRCTLPDCVQQ